MVGESAQEQKIFAKICVEENCVEKSLVINVSPGSLERIAVVSPASELAQV